MFTLFLLTVLSFVLATVLRLGGARPDFGRSVRGRYAALIANGRAAGSVGEAPTLTYKQAKNRLKDIDEELERLQAKADGSESRSLTDPDQEFWNELIAEARSLTAYALKLEREQELLEVRRANVGLAAKTGGVVRGSDDLDADPLGEPDSVESRRFKNPWDTSEIRLNASPEQVGSEMRARALAAVSEMRGTTDRRRQTATEILERFDDDHGSLSRIVLATSSPEYTRAFAKLARGWGQAQLTAEESAAVNHANDVARAMSLTTSAGGYLIPFHLDPTVINTSAGSRNDIRQAATQVVATANTWHGVSAGETSFSWDAEGAESSDDASTFAQPTITCFKGVGFVPISEEALQDEANVSAAVGELLASGKDTLEAVAFATGGGSSAPRGIVTAAVADTTPITSITTDTFAIADVYALQGALAAKYRANGSWLANNLTYNLIRQFDTAGGAGLWERIGADRPAQLMGRNAYEAEGMDGAVTALANNYTLIFGDLSRYYIADRLGLTVSFIPHLFHTDNNLPSGKSGWRATFRTGANLMDASAVKILNVT